MNKNRVRRQRKNSPKPRVPWNTAETATEIYEARLFKNQEGRKRRRRENFLKKLRESGLSQERIQRIMEGGDEAEEEEEETQEGGKESPPEEVRAG